ncbi:MAG: HAD-superfamily hydrolase, subfamily variant 3 [Phycisphaerales bacterium]|nr:HAD-superfamily hydrolase, subfamily variant 3 [Phycisphaerales bacterium]
MPVMALDALIFDIDGTLIDSNPAHVEAWRIAFERYGYRVARDRIEIEIGKGGDKLVPDILGREADEKDGDALRKAEPEEFAKIGKARGFRPFPRALDLLTTARQRGLKVVLATSSQKKQLATLQEYSGVDLEAACDILVTADDAEESKPAPDIIVAAVRKAKLSPAQCAMVGDTLYDMKSAKHAGVIGLGVLTGYQSAETLKQSGARAVYHDVAEILDNLHDVCHRASPTAVHLTTDLLDRLMRQALAAAREGMEAGEAPIGCVIADGHARIIARGFNRLNQTKDRTAHAEIVAFRAAAGKVPDDAKDLILVSTLEPCVMCTGAAMEAAVDTVAFALNAPADNGSTRVQPPQSPESQMPRIVGDILANESRALFKEFLKIARNPQQRAFTEQLLSLTSDR